MRNPKLSRLGYSWIISPYPGQIEDIIQYKPAVVKAIGSVNQLSDIKTGLGQNADQVLLVAREFMGEPIDDNFDRLMSYAGGNVQRAVEIEFDRIGHKIELAPRGTVLETSVNEYNPPTDPNGNPTPEAYQFVSLYRDYCLAWMNELFLRYQDHFLPGALTLAVGQMPELLMPILKPVAEKLIDLGGYYIRHSYFSLLPQHLYGPNQRDFYDVNKPPFIIENPQIYQTAYLFGRSALDLVYWGMATRIGDNITIHRAPNVCLGEFGMDAVPHIEPFAQYYGVTDPVRTWSDAGTHQLWQKMFGLNPIDAYMKGVEWVEEFAHRWPADFRLAWFAAGVNHPAWQGFELRGPMLDRVHEHIRTYQWSGGPVDPPDPPEDNVKDEIKALTKYIRDEVQPTINDILASLDGLQGTIETNTALIDQWADQCDDTPTDPPDPPTDDCVKTTDSLRIRTQPNTTAPTLRVMALGETCQKLGEVNGTPINGNPLWFHVKANLDGLEGYSHSAWLEPCDGGSTDPGNPNHAPLAGVHGPAEPFDYAWVINPIVEAVKNTNMKAVKILSANNVTGVWVDQLRANGVEFVMARLFATSFTSPDDFVYQVKNSAVSVYNSGVRVFEIHNEPNHPEDGFGQYWNNGSEFAIWFMQVRNQLQSLLPEAKFIFPGLSPSAHIPPNNGGEWQTFFNAAWQLITPKPDGIGYHVYWQDVGGQFAARDQVNEFAQKLPGYMIYVTEFSNTNPGQAKYGKGAQYADFYRAGYHQNVHSLYSFVVHSPVGLFDSESWLDDHGNGIIVGLQDNGFIG